MTELRGNQKVEEVAFRSYREAGLHILFESFHEIRNPFTEFGVLSQAEDERIHLF